MANVLGELFSEIAESIRGGLGDIGTMKPNAFPDKIDEIVELLKNAGSGGGSGEGGNGDSDSPSISNRFQLKSFKITTDAQGSKVVINHGMGKMPDMVFVYFADYDKDGPAGEIANGTYMLATYAMKREFNPDGVCQFYITRWISFSTGTVGEDKPTTDITSENSTAVFCPNDTQICFGSGNNAPNSNFNVIALSGVGGSAAPILESLNVIENGTYTPPDGVDGFSSVTVAVPSGDAGGNEEPLIKYCSRSTETTGSPTSSHKITFTLSKETKVLGAWAGGNQDKSVYPTTVNLVPVPVSNLTVDESNANYNTWSVPFEFYNPFLSGTYKKSIHTRLLVTVPGITVTSRGDGYYDGKLNYVDTYEYPIERNDFGTYTSLLFKKFTFAEGVSEVPEYLCYGQTYLDDVDLSNITSIGTCAFEKCTSLKSIKLSPDLSSIGRYAFRGCTSLTGELVIPPKVTLLTYYCFSETKFDRVVFHNNVAINDPAFYYCTHPTEFDFSACTSVIPLAYSNYLGTKGFGQVLKIPAALFDIWSTSENWSDWASQMVAV